MKQYLIFLSVWVSIINIEITSAHNTNNNHNQLSVYIDNNLAVTILKVEKLLPNYPWSSNFRDIHNQIINKNQSKVSYNALNSVINECITACVNLDYDKSMPLLETLDCYEHFLPSIKYNLEKDIASKSHKVCIPGPRGPMGPAGPAGTFSATYGQLLVSSQEISITSPDTWVAIPFTSAGVSSGMTVSTTPPATITVLTAGTYQINFSLYFSVADSDEGTVTQKTFSIGTKLNSGTTTPVAAVYCSEAGNLSLNYSAILELSANDQIQFYMSSSNTDISPFYNVITLENGNAYLMQISN